MMSLSTMDMLGTTEAADAGSTLVRETVIKVFYVICGICGMIGNSFVGGVLLSSPNLRKKVPNIFLINQCTIDFLASFLIIVYSLDHHVFTGLSGYADDLKCRLWLTRFPNFSVVMSSTYNLMAMTVDRYFRIVHPIKYNNSFNNKILIAELVFVWLIGPLYNFSWKYPSSGVVDGVCFMFSLYPTPLTQSLVGVFTVLLEYFIPLFLLAFCYSRMFFVIRTRVSQTKVVEIKSDQEGAQQVKPKNNFERAKNNIIKTLMLVAAAFVVCWTMNEMFLFLYFLNYPTDFSSTFYHVTVLLVFSNSCINPFIYCANYEDFRIRVKTIFKCHAAESEDNSVITNRTT